MSGAQDLFQELLRNANGDVALARTWMLQMGYPNPEQFRAETPRGALDKSELQAEVEASAPRHFFCPIGLNIMNDPVVLASGQTYDRVNIERYLAQGHRRCPVTQQILPVPIALNPNTVLHKSIEDWATRRAPWLLDPSGHLMAPKDNNADNFLTIAASAPSGIDVRPEALRRQAQDYDDRRTAHELAVKSVGSALAAGAAVGTGVALASGAGAEVASAPAALAGGAVAYPTVELAAGAQGPAGAAQAAYDSAQAPLYPALTPVPVGSMDASLALPPGEPLTVAKPAVVGALASPIHRRLVLVQVFLLCAAWIITFVLSVWKSDWILDDLALNPWAGANGDAMLLLGAQSHGPLVLEREVWRFLTSPFLPAGIIQLVPNIVMTPVFARHLSAVLPYPAFWIPICTMLSAWIGALTSANLNVYYVTTGATAIVAALLGGMWVDLGLNRDLYQLHWISALILFLTTGVLGTLSVLPYQDFWYLAAAFCSGAVLFGAVLTPPAVRRRRVLEDGLMGPPTRSSPEGRARRLRSLARGAALVLALTCVLGGLTIVAIGVGVKSEAGASCGKACLDLSCAPLDWWTCTPLAWRQVGDCAFGASPSGGAVVRCDSGQQIALPDVTSDVQDLRSYQATLICEASCSAGGGGPTAPGPATTSGSTPGVLV